MPTSVRLIKASNTPRDPQATDCSLLRGGGADAHLVDVLYKLRLAAASNDAAFVMEAADMQREKISSSVIRSSNKDGRSCLGKKCREKFMKDWPLTPKKEALKIARSMEYDGFEAYVKLKTRFARQTTAKAVLKMLEGGLRSSAHPSWRSRRQSGRS